MTNVQQLLDFLGPPPAEVCLDWAWQLLQTQESSPAAQIPTREDWSRWCLTEDGRLKTFPAELAVEFNSPNNSSCNSASRPADQQPSLGHSIADYDLRGGPASQQAACASQSTLHSPHANQIAQLLDWAGAEWEDGADRLSRETQFRAFHQRLAGCQATEAIRSEPRSKPTIATQNAVANIGRLTATASETATAVVNRKSRNRRQRPAQVPSRVKHFAIGTAVPLALALAGLNWFSSNTDRPRPTPSPDPYPSHFSLSTMNAERLAASQTPTDAASPANDLVVSSTSEYDPGPPQDSLERSLSTSPTTIAGSLFQSGRDSFAADSAATDSPAPELPGDSHDSNADLVWSSSSETDGRPLADNLGGSNKDDAVLTDEVAQLLRSAEPTEPMIRDIDVQPEVTENTTIPLQLVATGQMFQIQRLPERMRVREPHWQLRLVVSDRWTMQPQDPQGLSEKAVVRWNLLPQDVDGRNPQEVVQVLVQAQLSPRSPDIRWSIAAYLPELPSVLVPLDTKKLDAMLVALIQFQQRTATAINVAKAQSGQPGLPRPLRSSLLNQRKALETQSKLLEQAQRLVADASNLAGRLGESIEVHGQLTDMERPDQPRAILQVGDGAGGP